MTEKLSQFTKQTPTLTNFVAGANAGSPNQKYQLSDIQTLFGPATVTGPSVTTVTGAIYVNSFYPAGIPVGNIITSTAVINRPLSNFYATLAAAQAAFPNLNFATYGVTLADEVDWCVWQSCMDYIYNLPDYTVNPDGFKSATVVANGQYGINRTILCRLSSFVITAAVPGRILSGAAENNTTGISWVGAPGTVDLNKAIITIDASANAIFASGGIVEGLTFQAFVGGSFPPQLFSALNQACYVNGISVGNPANVASRNSFIEIRDCIFANGIWDAIKVIVAQIQCYIHRNNYAGVQRDANSVCAVNGNFSTLIWIEKNEYGVVGRYANLIDCAGSVTACTLIRDEDWEGTYNVSYFINNPEWFVQGMPAVSCFISNFPIYLRNIRTEGLAQNLWGDLHFISCDVTLDAFVGNGILFGAFGQPLRTPAGQTFFTTNNYFDITNTRNYIAPDPGAFAGPTGPVSIKNVFLGSSVYYRPGGVGLADAGNVFENAAAAPWLDIPTQVGSQGTLVGQPKTTAIPVLTDGLIGVRASCAACNGWITTRGAFFLYNTGAEYSAFTGPLRVLPGAWAVWQANTAYSIEVFGANNSNIFYKPFVTPATPNGFQFQCIQSGVSANVEPVWPTTVGNTVNDGGVIWKCVGVVSLVADVGAGGRDEMWINGSRSFNSPNYTIPPTIINYSPGDRAYFIGSGAPNSNKSPIGAVLLSPGNLVAYWTFFGEIAYSRNTSYASNATAGSFTATAAEIGGDPVSAGDSMCVLNLTGALGAGANIQLPTVASLVGAFTAPFLNSTNGGKSYTLRIINSGAGAFNWTVTMNAGWTPSGTMTIAQNTWRDFEVDIFDASTAVLINLGTGTFS